MILKLIYLLCFRDLAVTLSRKLETFVQFYNYIVFFFFTAKTSEYFIEETTNVLNLSIVSLICNGGDGSVVKTEYFIIISSFLDSNIYKRRIRFDCSFMIFQKRFNFRYFCCKSRYTTFPIFIS